MKHVLGAAIVGMMVAVGSAQQPAVDLKVGDKAPDFSLPGTDGKTHKLADYKGRAVVIAWYPAAFTGGCTAQCKSMRDAAETIKQFDVAYFMASTDTPERNADFAKEYTLNFPLLSDPAKTVAAAFGVLGPAGTSARATRWTYFIGADGKIAFVDKSGATAAAGENLAAKLAELGVKKR